MKIEEQVIDFETAQRLKARKVPQDSLWFWVAEDGRSPELAIHEENQNVFRLKSDCYADNGRLFVEFFSAFTETELKKHGLKFPEGGK